jgi:ribonuclease T2
MGYRVFAAGLALGAALLPHVAQAQAIACPANPHLPLLANPPKPGGGNDRPRNALITYYLLSLSWSPQFCSTAPGARAAFQCHDAHTHFGFVVHGLWPQGTSGKTHPQWCKYTQAPRITQAVVDKNACLLPSASTLEHEWLKHGTCAWPNAGAYWDTAGKLYAGLDLSAGVKLAGKPGLTVGNLRRALVAANRGLPAEAIRITQAGTALREVHICYNGDTRMLKPVPCQGNGQDSSDAARLTIDPVAQ